MRWCSAFSLTHVDTVHRYVYNTSIFFIMLLRTFLNRHFVGSTAASNRQRGKKIGPDILRPFYSNEKCDTLRRNREIVVFSNSFLFQRFEKGKPNQHIMCICLVILRWYVLYTRLWRTSKEIRATIKSNRGKVTCNAHSQLRSLNMWVASVFPDKMSFVDRQDDTDKIPNEEKPTLAAAGNRYPREEDGCDVVGCIGWLAD